MKIFNTEVKGKVVVNKRLTNADLERMVDPEKISSANEIIRRITLPDTSPKKDNK